jgi:hypothetical protein
MIITAPPLGNKKAAQDSITPEAAIISETATKL